MSTKIMVTLLAALFAAGIASGNPGVSDPPRVVLWHSIGGAGLRMTRAEVEGVYGRPSYPGLGSEDPQYRVRGGVLFIGYHEPCNSKGQCRGKVKEVSTDSPRYRTTTGLGVGTRIPFPQCKAQEKGECVRTWRGFRLGREPSTGVPVWWRWATYAGHPVTAFLDVTGAGLPPYRRVGTGVVFQLGFIDRRLPASWWRW
jgi:hypothetical protein